MVQVSYPGVYIQEVPSGVRTIAGVATSITAFIGASPRGPLDEPVFITSFADYERRFGGLSPASTMSYAVRDFYLNGGSQAVIVRVAKGATPATITLPAGTEALVLEAASPGAWGDRLGAAVNYDTRDRLDPSLRFDPDLFNLVINEAVDGGATETFLNVSHNPADPRFLPRVLEQGSRLVRVQKDAAGNWKIPATRPDLTLSPPSSPLGSPPDGPAAIVFKRADPGADGDLPTVTELRGSRSAKKGLYALEKADLFNLLCIPPPKRDGATPKDIYNDAMAYCVERRAMLIVDPPPGWAGENAVAAAIGGLTTDIGLAGVGARNAALYFPRVLQPDPLREGQIDTFVPCGIVAGLMAATDATRGVWKAPAGLDAALVGVDGLQVNLTDLENGRLNQLGINCLRAFPVNGRVVWGARTLRGADQLADEYKYVPVRRTALFIEESLYRGTQWVVFEPNDEPLWAQIRLNVGAFMHNLFRQGAFQGRTPREAYLVKCDRETTTQNDINLGIVNILVGFAPLKPAEFVIIRIQQLAGQVEA
ncbi:phage tail sheath family protein [Roseomonas sp. GCM10028921]